jgi:rubrerythrin
MGESATDPMDVLRKAIDMELEGMDFFERASERVEDQRAKDMFMGLLKQEQRHALVLAEELKGFEQGRTWAPLEETRRAVSGMQASSVFRDRAVKRLVMKPDMGELEVLRIGMAVEKKSIEYYRAAGKSVPDGRAKEVFNWLVGEEAGHLTVLNAEYDNRSRSGFHYDNAEFSLEVE